jgi:hypothetical protein
MTTDPRADKIREVALAVGARPSLLDALINFETAGTYDPLIENPLPDSTAIGLIQINDPTAYDLFGVSAKELVNKYPTFDSQMDNVVLPYLQQRKAAYNDNRPLFTKHELYMSVFYPAYISHDPDTLFSDSIQRANTYNIGDKTVTIRTPAEYAAFVDRRIREDTLIVPKLFPVILIGTGITGVAIWYLFRKRRLKRSRRQ